MYNWLFRRKVGVKSAPTATFHGSGVPSRIRNFYIYAVLINVLFLSAVTVCFNIHHNSKQTKKTKMLPSLSIYRYDKINRLPHLNSVIAISPPLQDAASLSHGFWTRWIPRVEHDWQSSLPLISIWTTMAVAMPGGFANAQLFGRKWKFHWNDPAERHIPLPKFPRNYIAAVIVRAH